MNEGEDEMHKVTREDTGRTEHLPDCAGYEGCFCFDMRFSYAEVFAVQRENARLREVLASIAGHCAPIMNDAVPSRHLAETIHNTAAAALSA
jgi:hypothetical protein